MAAITAPGLTVAQLDGMARSYEQAAECGAGEVAAAGWTSSPYFVSKILWSALSRLQQHQFTLEQDIAVNHVHPGFVDTGLANGLINSQELAMMKEYLITTQQ